MGGKRKNKAQNRALLLKHHSDMPTIVSEKQWRNATWCNSLVGTGKQALLPWDFGLPHLCQGPEASNLHTVEKLLVLAAHAKLSNVYSH